MGRVTKIETLNLQTFAIDLKAKGLSEAKIGLALTKKAGTPISRDMVNKFFRGRAQANVRAVEKKDKLAAKIVEAELNTINMNMDCLYLLKDAYNDAMKSGDIRAAILAVGEMHRGIDIINKTLHKYQSITQNNQFNFNEVNLTESHEKIVSRINGVAARIGTVQDTEVIEQ